MDLKKINDYLSQHSYFYKVSLRSNWVFAFAFIACVGFWGIINLGYYPHRTEKETIFSVSIQMEKLHLQQIKDEAYLCSALDVKIVLSASSSLSSLSSVYLMDMEFHNVSISGGRVHHAMLYGCSDIPLELRSKEVWFCMDRQYGNPCSNKRQIPLGYKTGNGSSPRFRYPPNVAYGLGPNFQVNYVLLEVHYLGTNHTEHDENQRGAGVKLSFTLSSPKYLAGTLTMARAGFAIPPNSSQFSVDMNCKYGKSRILYPFGLWVHTHSLGNVVSGYIYRASNNSLYELTRWSIQRPQPVVVNSYKTTILPGDFIAGRCTYNTSQLTQWTFWGHRKQNEMCNLFIFYSTEWSLSSVAPAGGNDEDDIISKEFSCVNEHVPELSQLLPPSSRILPPHLSIAV